ncbi:MAG: DUF1553 domain-containing protein [Planctomycetales bacterium]|nr:DUF1553 domain-containing protein [Planctomycetales bacterium]
MTVPIVLVLFCVLPVDFDHDIVPVLTKAGCNSGACHGAAAGRGELHLSLYGSDPAADYDALTRDLKGRRVNLADAEQSLVFLKATENISHGGGARLEWESPGADLLLRWIREGADRNATSARQLVRLDVTPRQHIAEVGEQLSLRAVAHFSDGHQRDVTPWTVFTAEDSGAMEIDSATANAAARRRGRHIIVARYLHQVVSLEVLVPNAIASGAGQDDPLGITATKHDNVIDRHVTERLWQLRIPQSSQLDDAGYLRRVTLDLTGRLPTLAESERFHESRDPAKRARLVDALLESEAFNEYWTWRLATMLRIQPRPSANGDLAATRTYHAWLREQVTQGAGYDRIASELLTAAGDTVELGPPNFYRTVAGPREQAELVAELFMGSRLRCANCHNHPLDRWTQDDYHGLAAIFAQVKAGQVVAPLPSGAVVHPKTGQNAATRIPGVRFLTADDAEPRQALARWLADPDNPYFSKAIVNRLWKAMMGRGLVEPVDDMRATNPATHPELLEELASDFAKHDFSLRHTLRRIANSAAYARSSTTRRGNALDQQFYSHALRRPLAAEVLADAISDVLLVPEKYGDQPLGVRALALINSREESTTLDVLGRCSRADSCEAGEPDGAGLPRMLHLINGPLLNARIADKGGRLAKRLAANQSLAEIVDEFYRAAFSRRPTASESAFWKTKCEQASNAQETEQLLEDFVWSLLTCDEFATNH